MAAARRRNLLSSRRRIDDEREEDEEVASVGDDSASDVSVLTDTEEDVKAEDSDLSDNDDGLPQHSGKGAKATKSISSQKEKPVAKVDKDTLDMKEPDITRLSTTEATPAPFPATADTLAMLNGLRTDESIQQNDVVDFEDSAEAPIQALQQTTMTGPAATSTLTPRRESLGQRRAREHEEYRLKKEADPAFVPNRGGFFMHDQRNDAFDPARPGSFGRGRGRGRDFLTNSRLPFRHGSIATEPNNARWAHDLHESVINPTPVTEQKPVAAQQPGSIVNRGDSDNIWPSTSLSSTTVVGQVMIRCCLPIHGRPSNFFKMAVRQHTQLPDLRPPLRRDKPVRVSLPDRGPRYVFPSTERSFIFIPRAHRPNQQVMKARPRGFLNQAQSPHTSAYGGSAYEPSVGMSRKSSVAQDGMAYQDMPLPFRGPIPVGPVLNKPVVRLPSNAQPYQVPPLLPTGGSLSHLSEVVANQASTAPFFSQHKDANALPMHQPQPQKTVSLATIEDPDHAQLHAPQQQEQQPFHHQVPAHMNGQIGPEGHVTPHITMPSVLSTSNLPSNFLESAINAQPFQPSAPIQQTMYPNPPYATTQALYYYPTQPDGPSDQYSADGLAPPMYVQQGPYLYPMYIPPAMVPEEAEAAAQASGMFAQERNGMVYYYDSSQMPGQESSTNADYTVPGAGGMLTPGPEGYYYSQAPPDVVYYPTQ